MINRVEPELPESRGETLTRVYGFPLSLEQCSKDFLTAFVNTPEIVTLMNQICDLDLNPEFYISEERWELRLKYSNREFPPHKVSYRFRLADKKPKSSVWHKTSFFK